MPQKMNPFQLSAALILLFILSFASSAVTSIPNFSEIMKIKTGDHKAITARLNEGTSIVKTQIFGRTLTTVPFVAIGLVIFEVEAGTSLSYTVTVSSVTTSGFTSTITTGTGTFINQLLYTYLALDSSQLYGVIPLQSGVLPLPVTNGQVVQPISIGRTLDTTHSFVIKTFLKDFSITRANNDLSIRIDAKLLSSTRFEVTLKTNSTVTATTFYLFWVDRTVLEASQLNFIDVGYAYGEGTGASDAVFNVQNNFFNYYNFMRGLTWLAFKAASTDTLFSLRIDNFPFQSLVTYKYGMANLLHWRSRQCGNSTPYYLEDQKKCYDSCPQGYANNVDFCQKCHYTCFACLADGRTCTSCPNATTSFRTALPVNGTCPCQPAYYDVGNGVSTCGACDYTCTTCVTSSTTCTSCHSSRDFNNVTSTCLCKVRSYDVGSPNPACAACHYTCLTCSETPNTCLTCNTAANRMMVLTSCLCKSGFSEATAGNELCTANPALTCAANCLTCAGTSTTCTGCDNSKKRRLVSSVCQCFAGYTSPNAVDTCTQICGDGLRFESACDDGNTNNGDGCSSSCTIQPNFTCNLTAQPNICIYNNRYTITVLKLTKRESENVIDAEFQISPAPPTSSVPSFNLPTLTILSYAINGGSLNLSVEYKQSIPEGTFASLSVSNVGSSDSFELKSSNNLSLNHYSALNYTAYKAQLVLVYIFVALSLLGCLIFLFKFHNGLLYVLEYLITVGIVWIGVCGMTSRYMLFYIPLRELKYIYGYNFTVSNEDGLFAFVNYGLILLIVPILATGINFLIRKIKPSIQWNQNSKKYVFVEVTYMMVCYYSIAVMYGLITEQLTKTYGTALSIASIVFGVIYFIGLTGFTVLLYKKMDAFINLREPMLYPKGSIYFPSILLQKHLSIIVYLLLCISLPSSMTKYPPFIFTGVSLINIILIVIIRPYKNNIRIILNEIMIMAAFLCYYIGLELSSAEWGGFLIVALLYLYMIYTFVGLGFAYYQNTKAAEKYSEDEQQEEQNEEEMEDEGHPDDTGNNLDKNKVDLDFDPEREIEENRMATVRKQGGITINPYAYTLNDTDHKEHTVRRVMLQNIQ